MGNTLQRVCPCLEENGDKKGQKDKMDKKNNTDKENLTPVKPYPVVLRAEAEQSRGNYAVFCD